MTREKAIEQELKTRHESPHYNAGFVEGAQWADAHPHWISVEEKMPPRWEKYPHLSNDVLCTDGMCVNINYYDYSEGEWTYGIGMHPITHWMPLPAPPTISILETTGEKGGEL